MNEPENHPTGPSNDTTGRRPLTIFALVASLALAAILAGCGNQQDSAERAAVPESSAAGELTARPDASTTSAEESAQKERSEPETSSSGVGSGESGPPTLGDEDAPVAMVEYADYQ